jgi:diguanylate cyclase (GGDEF)-like protein/PAS domain S-box-containing protein
VEIPVIEQASRYWARPDFQSLAFGRRGEVLAAKARLWVMALVALIPLESVLLRPPQAEARIGLGAAAAVFAVGIFVLRLAQRATPPAALGLFTCLLDVSIVSFVNAGFVLAGTPLAATNSRVVFCCYFVALALACLRQDWRWCLAATLAAMVQYGGIVLWAAARYDLRGPVFKLDGYGKFLWGNQVSRLLLLALTGGICILIVVQSRGYWKAVIQYLDSLPLGVLVTGRDGKARYANRAAQELLGRAVPEGVNLSELNAQAFLAGTGQRYPLERSATARALAGETTESDDLEIQRPDARIGVAVWGAPILDARGRVSHAVAVFHDQTRRRRAEEELRRTTAFLKASEERFRALLETAPDAIIIVDRSGAIVLVNTQTEKLFGYPRAELIGQAVEMLVPKDLREAHVGHRSAFLADCRARAMGSGLDLFARRKDGSIFPVEVSLSPLETEQGTLVSSAIRDVTGRRRLEHELREANTELSRLADLDALTGLANRRLFDRRLVAEWSRAARLNRHLVFPVALVLFDVDHFKAFNDQYGHLAGDACLRRVAEVLSAAIHREGDLAARYGGEEFAFLLPGTDQDGAWSVAEAVRLRIEDLAIQHGAPGASPTLTISAGVAALAPLVDMASDQLVEAADLALYSAKAMGRNRVARPPAT